MDKNKVKCPFCGHEQKQLKELINNISRKE